MNNITPFKDMAMTHYHQMAQPNVSRWMQIDR